MILLRRYLLAAAALALFAGLCSAQVSVPGGAGGQLTCGVLNTGNPTAVRAEGYSELLGDIVIQCLGGVQTGSVPLVNITVALSNTVVTSRVFPNGLSEALLLIDEPGAGAGVGAGGTLPQTLCSGGALGAGPGGCETQIGTAGSYTGAVLASNPSVVPNVFQGVVTNNVVEFHGIPLVAPVTAGYARWFRIVNIRASGAALASQMTGFQGSVPISAFVAISGGIPTSNPMQSVGYLYNGLDSTSVRNAANTAASTGIQIQQCVSNALTPGAVLRFAEGLPTGFRSRIGPTSELTGAGTSRSSGLTATVFAQNTPAQVLSGSESGFVLPVPGGSAGLADFGTRLKATFNNVPAGVGIYVSTSNLGTSTAALVSSETAGAAPGAALPLVTATHTANGLSLFGPLPVSNGTAIAVWEVLEPNPNALETLDFAVYYTSTVGAAPLTPAATVSLSYAPTYAAPLTSSVIPRMGTTAASANFITVSECTVAPAAISLSASPLPSVYKQPVTLTATVTGAGAPTGTVTFQDGAAVIGTAAVVSGKASLTTTSLSVGTHALLAVYSGDPNFAGATSGALTQTVNKASTTTALSLSSGEIRPGQTVGLTATVASSAGIPGGTVTFRQGGTAIGVIALNSSGVALLSTAPAEGLHNFTATYNGDANFAVSTSAAQGLAVSLYPATVTTPVLVSGTPTAGQSLTFSATVTAEGPVVTGMLTFRDDRAVLGASGLDRSGTATIAVSSLSAGQHYITASYDGDAAHSGAVSAALSIAIRGASTVTLTSSPNPSTPGAAVTFTATVAGPVTPTGLVNFTDGTTTLGSAPLNASGQAVLTVAAGLAAGEHSTVAAYGGNTHLTGASSAPLIHRVNRAATTTSLVETIAAGGFSLTAQVSASGSPGGTVQFRDLTAASTLGTATLAQGVALLAVPAPLPIGHVVQAAYEGDAMFAGSVSAPQPFVAVANGFSFGLGLAPDSVATIFGAALAASTASAPGLPLPESLEGARVRIVDSAGRESVAPLYFVSPAQINLVMPAAVAAGPAKLTLTTPDGSLSVGVTISATAPALTSADGSGAGIAAAHVIRLRRDGSQDAPMTVTAASVPYAVGDRLFAVLYGTGMRGAAGQATCSVNGQSVPPLFAGAHALYPGLDQINLEIPAGMRGSLAIACSTPGGTSNTVAINVQ